MKPIIIGIAGKKNAGKDTVASMINYIFYKGITQCNFQEWLLKQVSFDNTNKDRIIHFADPLKDCLSIIYNIPRKDFDDRDKKDNKWYSLTGGFYIDEHSSENPIYYKVVIQDLANINRLIDYINYAKNKNIHCIIKLRTLLQHFGTNICREYLGQDVWVNSVIGKAADIADRRGICIVPDMRYINEWQAITDSFLYGGDMEVKRDGNSNTEHSSEDIDFQCNYTILNNSSKMSLFYAVRNICQTIINK